MHYFDFGIKKTSAMLVFLILLASMVTWTFWWKEETFGSTPFFHSVGLLWARTVASASYSIERGTLLAALGFSGTLTAQVGGADTAAEAVPVLAYHRIVNPGDEVNKGNFDESDGYNISIAAFKDQMETLKRAGWQTVTLADFQKFTAGEITLPEKSFLLTFDDGTKDSFYPVDPILSALGFNAVEYVIVKDSHIDRSVYYLSPAEIHTMLATNRWEIGSHSYNAHVSYPIDAQNDLGHFYADLLWLPEENRIETPEEFTARVYEDLSSSRETLEDTYHASVTSLAFPFSNYGEDTLNFPGAESITLEEAQKVYDLVFSQVRSGMFTYNYPGKNSFHAVRIEPTPSWTGSDLLTAFNSGSPKELPYTDTLKNDAGWKESWGKVALQDGQITVGALADTTGGTAILDGTYLWNDYTFTAAAQWDGGYAVLLADVQEEGTSRACSFSDGEVRLQNRVQGTSVVLAEDANDSIESGQHTIGIRTVGTTAACLFDGAVVLSADTLEDASGGIGIESWAPQDGNSSVTISDIAVSSASDSYATTTPALY